jgi:hypothetical protein
MSESLTIKGVVIHILEEESGTSKAGKDWKKKDFVIETTEDQYPKKIAFTVFGDKIQSLFTFTEGQLVDVSFNLESREYNGKWFHNVNAWKIQPEEVNQNEHVEATGALPKEFEEVPKVNDSGSDDDLPF